MNIIVLISGNGSNLQAIIDRFNDDPSVTIQAVISNCADAYGLIRATTAGIKTYVIDHRDYAHRQDFDQALSAIIQPYAPDYLVLAGFMRILGADFVKQFPERIINIHPSLLPKYPGLNTHQRALDAGDKQHGVSIHIVTPELDAGPILAQQSFTIETHDTAATLAQKAHQIEHQLYPDTIQALQSQAK